VRLIAYFDWYRVLKVLKIRHLLLWPANLNRSPMHSCMLLIVQALRFSFAEMQTLCVTNKPIDNLNNLKSFRQ
jgi:hypothetical protein